MKITPFQGWFQYETRHQKWRRLVKILTRGMTTCEHNGTNFGICNSFICHHQSTANLIDCCGEPNLWFDLCRICQSLLIAIRALHLTPQKGVLNAFPEGKRLQGS